MQTLSSAGVPLSGAAAEAVWNTRLLERMDELERRIFEQSRQMTLERQWCVMLGLCHKFDRTSARDSVRLYTAPSA
eukprot:SAG31_NODE_5518_length_2482_cov_2.458666_2_plen_76_part_00